MSPVIIAGVLIPLAIAVALVLQRRRPQSPTQPHWSVPVQLDRADFERPEATWLVVVFSSTSCLSCLDAIAKAEVLASPRVAVQDVSYQARKDLHDRYAIETAPTIVVADSLGIVRASFVGTPSAADLWASVAQARVGEG